MKTIIFDWGGVCCTAAEPFANKRLQQTLGKNPDEIAAEVKQLYNEYYLGKRTREQFWQAIITHFGLRDFTVNELSDAYLASYESRKDVIALIKQLRKDYRLALLSNLTPEMKEHIKKAHHTDELFEQAFFSCDLGVMKPDAAAYRAVLQKLGVAPAECLFIDDSQKNVEAARALGIDAIHFTDSGALLLELIARGIRPVFLPNNHSEQVITRIPATAEEQARITPALRQYAIVPEQLERIDLPARNSVNYRCVCGNNAFFVRDYRGTSTKDMIQRSHQIINHCAAHGARVPPVLLAANGSTLVENEGRFFALFPFIDGLNYQGSIEELRSAATAIAMLHCALAKLPEGLVKEFQQALPPAYATTQISLADLDRIATATASGTTAFDRAVHAIMPELCSATKQVLAKRAARLPMQVIHSDLHPHNLLVKDNHVQAILDFDAVRWNARARDVGFALHRLVRQHIVQNPTAGIGTSSSAFLTAYERENSLTPEERAALVPFMREELVQKLHFVLRNHYLINDITWDADFAKFVMLWDEITLFERVGIAA